MNLRILKNNKVIEEFTNLIEDECCQVSMEIDGKDVILPYGPFTIEREFENGTSMVDF